MTRGGRVAGSGTVLTSTSPVRVKVTGRLLAQPTAISWLDSPARVPSGRGCSVNTSHTSPTAFPQFVEPTPTATQLSPTWSNTIVGICIVSPLSRDAFATQPSGRHTERKPQVSVVGVAPGACLPSTPVTLPKSTVYTPLSHFVLAGRWPTTLRLTESACPIVADFLRNSCGYCFVPVTCRKPRSVPRGEREVGRRPRVRTEAST